MKTSLRRWASIMLVAGLVAAGCVAAGIWQWHRHEQRLVVVEQVLDSYDAPAVPIGTLVETGAADAPATLPASSQWHPATVTGRYRTGTTVLLRNRPVGGVPGFHLLEPFEITEGLLAGRILLVDRGWVPTGADSSVADAVPPPPAGTVELVVRLRPDEPASSRRPVAGQVHAINLAQVRDAAATWPAGTALGFYGQVAQEDGTAPAGLGTLARPSTDLGSHLSYTFQWWIFALGALGGGVLLGVREGRAADHDSPGAGTPGGPGDPGGPDGPEDPDGPDRHSGPRGAAGRPTRPARPARRRRPTAEEEEDALIDAQLR